MYFFLIHCGISDHMLYLCVPAVPWSLHCHLQQYGEPEALPLGVHLHALHVLLFTRLHPDRCFPLRRPASSISWDCLEPPTMLPPFSLCRCVRLHDLWTGGCLRYSDVLSWEWRGHDHFQTTFWNIDHHHLPDHSAPGKVSATWVKVCSPTWVSHHRNVLSRCPSPEQVCHPELVSASWETSARNSHSFLWEPLQSRSHCDLDKCHCPHRHVCPRHEQGHQCHRRNQRLLHLYFPWWLKVLSSLRCNVSVCSHSKLG